MKDVFALEKAADDEIKYSDTALSLAIALSGLCAFGGLVCICMIIISAFSGGEFQHMSSLAAAFVFMIVCSVVFVLANIIYKRRKNIYLASRQELYKTAERIEGKIIGVTKYVRHVKYMRDTFDEIQWCFKIEYSDGDETKTVESDRYLNDISKVLADDNVTVLVLADNTLVFDGYRLRKTENEPYAELDVEEIEQESEV